MKIITDRFPEDGEVLVDKISITYYQEPDCTEDRDGDGQYLTIETRNNGIANFLNIKTNGWSIDGDEDLSEIINDFKRRAGFEKCFIKENK